MRLIDADALVIAESYRAKNASNEGISDAYRQALWDIAHCETIEAEPVVRCRDCRKRRSRECPMCDCEQLWDEDDGWVDAFRDRTVDEGYCHMGVKMDGKGIDVPGKICPATKLPCCDCVPGTPCAKMDGGTDHAAD